MILPAIFFLSFLILVATEPLHYDSTLTLNQRKIHAGQIHYSRIPVEYWEHRIMMIKSMGLNALSVYVMWNYHQISKGVFDFQTGNRNLRLFLKLAWKHELMVLIRPGPYVCAEWDFGGLPARLFSIKGIKVRQNNILFLKQVKIYFSAISTILRNYFVTQKGPIILLQIQNQYGSYGNDKQYINAIRKIWEYLKITIDQYQEDGVKFIANSHWENSNIGISGGNTQQKFSSARNQSSSSFIFGGEVYSGWLTHWNQSWKGKNMSKFIEQYQFLFQSNYSFSMYMAHGGTNFGLTAGANSYVSNYDYMAHVTSYDYNSPINEQGSPTQKFHQFRKLISKYVNYDIIDIPPSLPMIKIPSFKPSFVGSLFDILDSPNLVNITEIPTFQSLQLKMWNQGFVLYQTQLKEARKYEFETIVHDFALIYLDGKHINTLNRSENTTHHFSIQCQKIVCNLSILVQAMGHINYGPLINDDKKGIIMFKENKGEIFHWNVSRIPLNRKILLLRENMEKKQIRDSPSIYRTQIKIEGDLGDTYFDMKGFTKGYIWINGINLGRYWNIGPQYRLFCPKTLLKQQKNQIIILDLFQNKEQQIKGQLELV